MVLVAAGQLCSSSCLKENGFKAAKLIKKAASLNCKVLFLPEASDYIAANARHSKEIVQTFENSSFIKIIRSTLKELYNNGNSLQVAVGIHEPSSEESKSNEFPRTKNTLVYLDEQGDLIYRYQKIHLFDVDIKDGPILKESMSVQPGNYILKPFDSPIGKLGLGICYDLRFPELALRLRSLGAQVLTYPSAWTVKTGPHFQILGRSTALNTQCYVILPAQKGKHVTQSIEEIAKDGLILKRESYGHTCIIDPHGTILAECSEVNDDEQICVADIDLKIIETVRKNMPLWDQRRDDVFGYKV